MSSISRANKTASGTRNYQSNSTIKSSEVNADFNTIYDDYNGSVDNDNISASAGILASKLDLSTIAQSVYFTGNITITNALNTATFDTLTAGTVVKTPSLTIDKLQIYNDVNTTPTTLDKLFFKDVDDNDNIKQNTIQGVFDQVSDTLKQVRGWINFNGTGTIAINDSFNVSGIVDNGTGLYTVTWDTDFANNDYAISLGSDNYSIDIRAIAVGSTQVRTRNTSAAAEDSATICVIAIGDQ